MSKHHNSTAHQTSHLLKLVKDCKTPEEMYDLHGITIEQDGSVIDSTYNKQFKNIGDWALFVIEQEQGEEEYEDDTYNSKYDDLDE